MTNQVEQAKRIAAARRMLQRAMGRLVAGQATHDATSGEGASGARGEEQPEAGAGEEVGAGSDRDSHACATSFHGRMLDAPSEK